jgi:hypothetical protein
MLNYLGRLKTRMEKTRRQNSKLYKLVDKAHDAVHALSVDLHYLSCGHGVYREPEEIRRACGLTAVGRSVGFRSIGQPISLVMAAATIMAVVQTNISIPTPASIGPKDAIPRWALRPGQQTHRLVLHICHLRQTIDHSIV